LLSNTKVSCHFAPKGRARHSSDTHFEQQVPQPAKGFPAVALTGPEVFEYVRVRIDPQLRRVGPWLLPRCWIRRCFGQLFREIGQVHPAAEGHQLLSPALLPA